ncbi:MAG: SPFH domain-containing protein [Pseudomonadota bacterium]
MFSKKKKDKKEKDDLPKITFISLLLKSFFFVLLIGALALAVLGMQKVAVTEVGVKINRIEIPYLMESGIQPKVYHPGYVFSIPFIQKVDVIDAKIKSYDMSKTFSGNKLDGDKALEIRTFDESTVFVDITILYQIDRNKAYIFWGNVAKTSGSESSYYSEVIKTLNNEIRDQMLFSLGVLGRDDFYSKSQGREDLAMKAKEVINRKFDKDNLGIIIVDIFLRDFSYSADYEAKILDKSLTEQFALVEKSKVKVEEVRKVLNADILSAGEAQIRIIQEEGFAAERQIMADGDLYLTSKKAEGDLAIKIATAEGKLALAQAFKGEGGNISVAIEMAKRLKELDTIILQSGGKDGLNPLNVEDMTKMFGVK